MTFVSYVEPYIFTSAFLQADYQFIKYDISDDIVIPFRQNLMVFKKDLVGHAQYVLADTKSPLDVIIERPWHNDIDETVCIENYSTFCCYYNESVAVL